jgi:hypothetical protein
MKLIQELLELDVELEEDWRQNEAQTKIAEAKRGVDSTINFVQTNLDEITKYCEAHAKPVRKLEELRTYLTASYQILDELSK